MKLLTSKHDPTKGILLAFEEDDVKTLHLLHDNSLVFGMYLVWFKPAGIIRRWSEQIQPIVDKFPSVKGIAFINVVKGFAPVATKEDKNESRV